MPGPRHDWQPEQNRSEMVDVSVRLAHLAHCAQGMRFETCTHKNAPGLVRERNRRVGCGRTRWMSERVVYEPQGDLDCLGWGPGYHFKGINQSTLLRRRIRAFDSLIPLRQTCINIGTPDPLLFPGQEQLPGQCPRLPGFFDSALLHQRPYPVRRV